jgi:hypothetical protein
MKQVHFFLCRPDKHPERAATGEFVYHWWSCNPEVKKGDLILVYVTRGVGILYLWKADSDAEYNPNDWSEHSCYVTKARKHQFLRPLTCAALKALFSRDEWIDPHWDFHPKGGVPNEQLLTRDVAERILKYTGPLVEGEHYEAPR